MSRLACRLSLIPLLCSLFCLTGCSGSDGPETYTVSGKVTFQSQPVPVGSISFFDEATGASGQAALNEDGSYSVPLQAGSYQVAVTPPFQTDVASVNTPREGEYLKVDNIPAKYRMEGTSGFQAEVSQTSTTFDFDMQP